MRRAIVSTKGVVTHPVDDLQLIDAKVTDQKVLWLDITDPQEDDFQLLGSGFGFHALAIDDLRQSHGAPKLDEYEDHVFQVVMVPTCMSDSGEDVELLEVEIFYTKGTLVTVHDRAWPALDALWEAIQRDPIHGLGKGAQTIYHDLVQRGVSAYFSVLDRFDERVEEIERKVFETAGGDTLPALFHLRRSVRQILRAARSQRESVQRLAAGVVHSLTRETCYLFRDVHDQLLLIHDTLDDHRETLGSLRDTYLGVINNRMSEIMKTLTIFSAVLLPLAFLTGLYGMNFDALPGKGSPAGFWVFVAACLALVGAMLAWFARRGWLKRLT
jgi:magnesium transporter